MAVDGLEAFYVEDWILVCTEVGTVLTLRFTNHTNPTGISHTQMDLKAEVGSRIKHIFPAVPDTLLQRYVDVLRTGQLANIGEIPYQDDRMGTGYLNIQAIPLWPTHLGIVVEDITERHEAAEMLLTTNNSVQG